MQALETEAQTMRWRRERASNFNQKVVAAPFLCGRDRLLLQ